MNPPDPFFQNTVPVNPLAMVPNMMFPLMNLSMFPSHLLIPTQGHHPFHPTPSPQPPMLLPYFPWALWAPQTASKPQQLTSSASPMTIPHPPIVSRDAPAKDSVKTQHQKPKNTTGTLNTKNSKRYSTSQTAALEWQFRQSTKTPKSCVSADLQKKTGLTPIQIKKWFAYKRMTMCDQTEKLQLEIAAKYQNQAA